MVVRRQYLRCALAASAGAAASTAHPLGIIAAIAMPALGLSQESRYGGFSAALSYYGAALWPLIPGARNFFGPDVSALVAIALWVVSSILLALPWALVWSPVQCQALWRAPVGVALMVIPPLGIIGWASPLTAAGILFPGMAWSGLLFCAVSSGCLAVWPLRTAGVLAAVSIACNIGFPEPRRLPEWKAINTTFGAIAHGSENSIAEHQAAQWIQQQALTASAKVIVFPETVVPTWTLATDAFWQQTFDRLRSSGKTILVGARIPIPSRKVSPSRYDFSTDLAALNGTPRSIIPALASEAAPITEPPFAYENAVILRGAETGAFKQRIPVPIAMWNPLKTTAARLNLYGSGAIDIHGERAAVLICYEQLLTWPVLLSMAERPTVLIALANDHWATDTPIPRFQLSAVRAWARLFRLPYLSAVNT
jgi:hypothetical protein